jgi:DNA invertase Pin-like site-specific DNA recombinase
MVFAEFERNLISDRTKSGIASKRAGGATWGRPVEMTSREQFDIIKKELKKGTKPKDIYTKLGISRFAFYRYKKYIKNYKKRLLC